MSPLPADGWRILQSMLPEIGASVHDAPSDCKVLLGDAMSIFRTEAEQSSAASTQLLLKLCRDFTLQAQKRHEGSELAVTDSTVDSVLVHVAALSSSLLQVQVDTLPAAAVEIEKTEADGLSTFATLQGDTKFIARYEELARVGRVLEDVFTSIAPAPRDVLLLHGVSGLGKSAAAKQGLKLMQDQYCAASCCYGVHVPSIVRGRGAAAVREDLVRWGRDLGPIIGVGTGCRAASAEIVFGAGAVRCSD